MKKSELTELIKNIGDDGSVDEVLSASESFKSLINGNLTLDAFKEKLNDPVFKSFMDSEKDKHSTKHLDTWKTNSLQKLIDDEIKKRYPDKDPKELELENMKKEIEQMKKSKTREELINKAIKIASEKKLPMELVDYFLGEDEATTSANLDKLNNVITNHLQTMVADKFKENSYTPPRTSDNTKNPWSKEHYNLTEQGKILKENPELAKQFMGQ